MARFDLTDFAWSVIQPLLPQKSRGVKRVDDRRVLNGIEPHAYLNRTLTAIVNGHRQSRIEELLPWSYKD